MDPTAVFPTTERAFVPWAVEMLLELKVNPASPVNFAPSAIQSAACFRDSTCLRILIEQCRGPLNVNITNHVDTGSNVGWSPRHPSKPNKTMGSFGPGLTALMNASRIGNAESVRLLIDAVSQSSGPRSNITTSPITINGHQLYHSQGGTRQHARLLGRVRTALRR